jgi:two-component system, cell cycle sensor histidine kinase and response regulator CckA
LATDTTAARQRTVLVVDDEEMLRKVTRRLLERLGYRVLTAADGEEAVALFRSDAQAADAVLLDMSMPRLDGRATFAELMKIRPDLPVVLSSGFDERDHTPVRPAPSRTAFIQKPYQVDALRKVFERVLLG